jgi:glycosyltransferase involved in cell wall biosynthesis
MPSISICIPTLSRVNSRKHCLDLIGWVLGDENYEVCISNNDSTDGTNAFLD